jgi:SNF2 family DNA or RNA helicase
MVVSHEAMQLLESVTAIREVPLPETVNATLRHYQQRGFEWMYKNSLLQMGSILADDMGLGKTLQVLALLEVHRLKGTLDKAPALAVVPTSLVTNWCKEAEKFTPHLKVATYHGPNRKMPTEPVHLLVTTYGMVRSDENQFHSTTWPFLIIDEAQNIKNPSAGQTKATKAIPASCRIALSGTPVENRLLDFWSILDFAQPQFFGSETEFRKQFALPIAQQRDMEVLSSFKALSGPFILRREKSDPNIISDLPEKVMQDHWCNLKPAQAALYKGLVNSGLESLDSASSEFEHSGLVLLMLTALKQTCNHPVNYLKKGKTEFGESGKAEVLENLIENILEGGEKALIFTQYKEMGELIQQMVSKKFKMEIPFLHGGTTRKKRDEMVQRFQEDPNVPIQLLSLKAGGTGLNLTAATHVIHYDLWWNPAVENQATDRAYRIGQKRNVMVHRLLSVGTLEERIDAMLQAKRELANLTVSSGELWIGDLSKEELKKLVEFAG